MVNIKYCPGRCIVSCCRKAAKKRGACGFAAKKERRKTGFIAYLIDNEHYDRCR
jgi:hypothetical protein